MSAVRRIASMMLVSHAIKRLLFFGIVALALLSPMLLLWLGTNSTPAIPDTLTKKDFIEIKQAIRHAMWQRTFPSFSWQSISQAPRWLVRLATSRIRQVKVLAEDYVEVRTSSPFGDYFYAVDRLNLRHDKAPRNWRVSMEGPSSLVLVTRIAEDSEAIGSGSSHGQIGAGSLSLSSSGRGTRVLRFDYSTTHPGSVSAVRPHSQSSPATSRSEVLSESEFAGSLTNQTKLDLRP
jgi:hypothetical protein